ncbi:MAG: hypothetical protein WD552_02180 [Candidatus Paceibacterota bacterium]
MNFESNNNLKNVDKTETLSVFDTGIDIDDPNIFETLSEDERRFIIDNRDLFEQFNSVRSQKQAREIVSNQTQLKDGSIEKAKEMYDLVKQIKEIYRSK